MVYVEVLVKISDDMTCDPRREENLEKDLLLETLCPTLTRSKTVNIWKQRDYKKIFNKLSVAMTADFKAKKLTENVQENDTEANEAKHKVSYTTYSERWVLIPNWMWTWFDSCLRQNIHIRTLLFPDGGYLEPSFCSILQTMLTGSHSPQWQKRWYKIFDFSVKSKHF